MLAGLSIASCSGSGDIAPFTTDGCSAFPDGTSAQADLWQDCCARHDIAYWMGGSRAQRGQADSDLQACVESAGEPQIAALMLAGVTVGGTPYLPTDFRWGYGWPFTRGYQALTGDEQATLDEMVRNKEHLKAKRD